MIADFEAPLIERNVACLGKKKNTSQYTYTVDKGRVWGTLNWEECRMPRQYTYTGDDSWFWGTLNWEECRVPREKKKSGQYRYAGDNGRVSGTLNWEECRVPRKVGVFQWECFVIHVCSEYLWFVKNLWELQGYAWMWVDVNEKDSHSCVRVCVWVCYELLLWEWQECGWMWVDIFTTIQRMQSRSWRSMSRPLGL